MYDWDRGTQMEMKRIKACRSSVELSSPLCCVILENLRRCLVSL